MINDDVLARSMINLLASPSEDVCLLSCTQIDDQVSSLTIYMMIDENIVSHSASIEKLCFNDNRGCVNGNCPSYIHEVIGYYKK